MKTISDKSSCTLIAFIFLLACWFFPSSIWASVEVDGIYYDLNTTAKTAAVASNPNYYTGAIDIPSSFVYNGSTYNVKSIGSRAFLSCSEMTSINFPTSVTSIGSSAFERCTGLAEVVIGSGVTSIDYEAFKNCSGIRSLTLPSSLKTIENEAFSGCTSLAEIIAKRTTPPTIVSTTFEGVDKTACMVYVPEGCKSTYANATNWKVFSSIVELTVVATGSCGDNVTYTIYSDMTMVISGTGAMKNYVGDNGGSIYRMNDTYYKRVKRVIIEDGVTTIGNAAFFDFSALISVLIPNSVTRIGISAFSICTGLTSVLIPNSVTYIGMCAFEASGLTSISIPNSVNTIENQAFQGCSNLTTVIIGSGDLKFNGRGFIFNGCNSLTSIIVDKENQKYDSRNNCNAIIETSTNTVILGCKNTVIPSSVTSIGYEAFNGCDGLTSISIPISVTSIGSSAFSSCSNLSYVSIPSSVTSIGSYAFCYCSDLTSISIPYSVNYIGNGAFGGCTNLSWISVASSNSYYDSRDNCNAIIETSTNKLVAGCKNTVIPNSVTSIGSYAFYYCYGLSSVTIPNNVTSIGSYAFCNCDGLTSVTIPNNVTSIGNYAFNWCDGLTSVSIGNSVTSIGSYAFNWCEGLTSMTIPNSVTTIGDYAFYYCWKMTSATIPSSVTSIGDYAFADCSGLTSVIEENTTPIAISYKVFNNVDKAACTLYVPTGSKEAYESASYWNDFQNIEEYGLGPGTDISDLDNAIYVEQVEGRIGGTMNIPVRLKNFYGVRGFQFTLELPEGTSINSWSLSTNRLPSGATLSDKIATQKIEGNKITVACSLNYGDATFTGNDGEIATVNVTFDDDMEVGTYPIYLTACDVTTASGVDEDLSDVTATLVLEDYVVGDANGDGKVRIGDATTILNYIVGTTSDNFKEKAADANGDGKIRIGDATTILNIIVNQ